MPQHHANPVGSVLPPKSATPTPPPDNSRTIAILQQWAWEDATDDPATIALAEQELAQFKAGLLSARIAHLTNLSFRDPLPSAGFRPARTRDAA
jgi:hypothetical protein